MKVLIVGAGVIGSIYGWAFSEAGHSITHLVRPRRANQYNNGITIDLMDRRKGYKKWFKGFYNIQVTENNTANIDYDIIIVPVKHYVIEDTLKQLIPLMPKADYLLLTQNWNGTAGIDNILSIDKCVFGDAKAGGSFQDNKLVGTIYAIDIGIIGSKENESLIKVKNLFLSAGIKTTIQDNILHYLWVQYALNGGAWPALIQAGSLKALLKNPQLVKSSILAIKECLNILIARGVEIKKFNETDIYITNSPLKKIIGLLLMKLFLNSKYVQRNSAHALADPKEIKTFYYDLIGTGNNLGVEMPVMKSFKEVIDNFGIKTE
jgi:2-dehydropantoate 2-reductase